MFKKLLYLFILITWSVNLFAKGPPPPRTYTKISLHRLSVIENLESDGIMEVFSRYFHRTGYTGGDSSYTQYHTKTLEYGLVLYDDRYDLYIRTLNNQKIKVSDYKYSNHRTKFYYGNSSVTLNIKLVKVSVGTNGRITIYDLYDAMKNYSIFTTGSTKSIASDPPPGQASYTQRTLKSDEPMYYAKYGNTELLSFTKKHPYFLIEKYLFGRKIEEKIETYTYVQTEYKIIDSTAPIAAIPLPVNNGTSYSLTASNITDGAGVGIKEYYWKTFVGNIESRTIHNKQLETNKNETKAIFYTIDNLGNSKPHPYNVTIETTPPDLGLDTIPTCVSDVSGDTLLAADPTDPGGSGVTLCYWTLNGVRQPDNVKTLNLTIGNLNPGSNTVVFYAQDRADNNNSSSHTIIYDNIKPTINPPQFKEYREINGVLHTVFTWSSGTDSGGSGLLSSKLICNSEEITETGEFSVPFDNVTEKLTLITKAEDRAGNVTDDSTHTINYTFPVCIQFDNGLYPSEELRPEVDNGKISYPVKLPLTFGNNEDFSSVITSNNANNISYEIASTIGGVTKSEVISTGDLVPDNTLSSVMYYPYSVKGASGESLDGQSVTYSVKTIYNNSTVLFENTLPVKMLPKVGSIPVLNTSDGELYLNSEPKVLLTEKDSILGTDLDGYEIIYKLMYKKPGAAGYIESSGIHDITSSDVKLLDRDGINIFADNGIYELKVVSEYKDPSIGNNIFESNTLSINFDRAPPSKPVISFKPGSEKLTKDSIDFTINNLQDLGESGISHIFIWTQVEGKEAGLPVQYDIADGTDSLDFTSFEFPEVITGERQNVSVVVKSVDRSGNESEETTEVIDVDKERPVITGADYICTENSIRFNWNCIDQVELQLNDGDWIKSADKTLFIDNLGFNDKQVLDIKVKDAAGNISDETRITGYTLDVVEPIVQEYIKQEVSNGSRYIYFSFPTTEEKALRYSITRVVDGVETALTGSYSNGNGRFEYEYTEKKRHDFRVNIVNSGGRFNRDKELNFSFTPANNKPVFLNDDLTIPENSGYASLNGLLEWPEAIEHDTDDALLKYIVTITPEGGSAIVYDPAEPLTENRLLLNTILGSELKNNISYTWSVTANDGYENSLPISDKVFRVDDNRPVVNITNNKTEGYTNSLSFNITDSDSGLLSVKLHVNDIEFTDYTVSGDEYIIDMTALSSGKYSVKLDAADKVGNIKSEVLDILYDGEIPEIVGNIIPELKSSATEYFSSDKRFNISFNVLDDYSGVENIYYGFSPDNSALPIEWFSANDNGRVFNTKDREVSVNIPVNCSSADGVSSYLFVKLADKAGHESQIIELSKPIYVDSTAPVLENLELTGLIYNNHNSYLKSINDLKINAVFKDTEEQLDTGNYIYTLKSDSNTTVLKDSGSTEYNPVVLEEGKNYILEVTAINRTGKSVSAIAESFIYDSLPPVNAKVVVENSENYVSGNNINIDLEAEEGGSGIFISEVKIGSSDGLSDVGSETLTDSWKRTGNKYYNSLDFKLPENIEDGNYFITASFIDAVGNSVTSKTGFKVDNTIPKLTVNAAPHTSSDSSNSVSWNFSENDLVSKVFYRLSGETEWAEISYPGSGNIIYFSNMLNSGETYYIEVKVITTGNTEFIARSNSFTYDNSNPLDLLTDAESWPQYIRSGELKTNWKINDNESGISKIKHRIEIQKGLNWENLTEWILESQLNESGSRSFNGLNLKQSDKIRVRRIIRNGVGATTERLSPVIIVDNNVPDKLINIIANASYLKTSAIPKANWMNTSFDSDSGMKYYWTFDKSITDKESITEWVADDGSHRAVVDIPSMNTKPQNGETWYFLVKGVNGVGMETYGSSYGVTFDDLAPELLEVTLKGDNTTEHIYYLNDQNNLTVNIYAFDQSGSELNYTSDFGYYNNLGEYTLLSDSNLYTGTDGEFLVLPSQKELIINSNKLVIYRADVTDEAGNINRLAYSPGTLFDNTDPEIINHSYYLSNGKLFVNWDSIEGNTSIKEYRLTMKMGTKVIPLPDSGIVRSKSAVIEVTDYDDGIYTLYIEAVSESGLTSEKAVISEILLDNNRPSIVNIEVSTYIYRDLKPEISLIESGSGISEYQYSVGTTGSPGSITNGWISVENSIPELFKPVINLMDYADGYNNTVNGDTIYISFMAKDRAGNWSTVVKSPGIILDKTPAENLSISTPLLSNKKDRIESITIKGSDLTSGLERIELTLFKMDNGTAIEAGRITENIKTSVIIKDIDVTDFIYKKDNLELLDNGIYRIGYRLGNGTGVYSPMVYSNDFRVDLTLPEILFTADDLVFNENLLPVAYTVSEDAKLELELIKDLEVRDSVNIENQVAGSYEYLFDHKYIDEELAYGNYTLRAILTDPAGNVTSYENVIANIKKIRYNEPPRITFESSDFKTTPGRPFKVTPLSVVDNDDDSNLLTYSWTFETTGNSNIPGSTDSNPVVKFYHSDNRSSSTRYRVVLTVTDPYGKSATQDHYVTVENTKAGFLYHNEFWRDTHYVDGDITIPPDIKLTIEPLTSVKVSGEYGIYVDGSLEVSSGSTFTSSDASGSFWSGISVNSGGTAVIDNSNISRALRGIAVINSGNLSITDTTIENNVIGVHAFNSSPVLTNCVITNNSAYGLKEDGVSEPVLNSTLITGNTLNIYDSVSTIELGESR